MAVAFGVTCKTMIQRVRHLWRKHLSGTYMCDVIDELKALMRGHRTAEDELGRTLDLDMVP